MATQGTAPLVSAAAAHIPSPPVNGFHIGPLFIHFYAVMYLVGIAAAIYITRRRWVRAGGDPELMYDVAMWSVPAGIIGGRIYFDVTTPAYIPHVWYGVLAIWDGGLGIWGAIPVAVLVGIWRVRHFGGSITLAMDAVAPALLVAQGLGRIGNYFNKELFGGPTSLPWGLAIPVADRPAGYTAFGYFHPTFLYELIWDFALAVFLVWLGHHRKILAPGLFALYVAGYSAFRIFEESLRVDPSQHFLGLRLNMYVACGLTVIGAGWFAGIQRRGHRRAAAGLPAPELAAGNAQPGYLARDTQADGVLSEAGAAADDPGAEAAAATTGTPGTPDPEPHTPDPEPHTPDLEPATPGSEQAPPGSEPAGKSSAD